MQTNIFYKIGSASLIVIVFGFLLTTSAIAITNPEVQTNSATNVQYNSATLNGNVTSLGQASYTSVWFQWGLTTSYGNETTHATISYPESFSHSIYNLAPNTAFHYRAVSQNSYGTVYGSDMTFTTGQGGSQLITVNAGPDLYITSGQSVVLQGSGADNSSSSVTYRWSCNGGNLSNAYIAQPTYTSPYIAGEGTYSCTLTVANTNGNSNSDSAVIYTNYNNNDSFLAQTNSVTNLNNNQVTLNGYTSGSNSYNTKGWFEWGTSTSYGNTTSQQTLTYSGSFNQNISGLYSNTTYHYRAVAQNSSGHIVYGQDMTFYTGSYSTGSLIVNKKVINLSSGNLNWQTSVSAVPTNILSFAITIQSGNQDLHNVFVRDILPTNINYLGKLTINTNQNQVEDITDGINIGTVYANQPVVISYQAQVGPATNFTYGTTTLTSGATVSSNETSNQTSAAQVLVTNSLVQGATILPTGLTNYFFADSFLLPLLLLIIGLWFYFSGNVYKFADWLKSKR